MRRSILIFAALLAAPLVALHAAGGGSRLEPFEPANGEKLINYHPHFQWRGPEMTLDYQPECEIQIATEPDFKKLLATDVIGGGMNRFYSMVSLTEQREYFWRVRIQKPEAGPWSETLIWLRFWQAGMCVLCHLDDLLLGLFFSPQKQTDRPG